MLRILQNILQSISKFIKFLQEKIMPIFNISKVGSVNSGSDVISKVYAGSDLVYSAVQPNGYLFRDLDDTTGTLSAATGELEDASEITEIPDHGLYYGFYECTGLTGSVSFPNLTSVADYGMNYGFYGCTGLTGSVSFPSLTSIESNGMEYCFYRCTGLTGSVSFPNLTSVAFIGLSSCFKGCTGLTGSVSFPSLTSIESRSMMHCFMGCTGLTGSVSFPSLTSIGDYGMNNCFSNTSVTQVHFKSSLSGNTQCTASNLGITGNVYFDL